MSLRYSSVIEPQSIAEILGLGASIRTVSELEAAVSAGLPKRSLERLSARLYEDRRVASAYKFKVVPQATWKRRSKRLSVDESERTERLARVLAAAEHVWSDREDAREWMRKPHRELNGLPRTPSPAASAFSAYSPDVLRTTPTCSMARKVRKSGWRISARLSVKRCSRCRSFMPEISGQWPN
jgi:putative toxin-antitoxin system antitoxin component (TIGR02293 family)